MCDARTDDLVNKTCRSRVLTVARNAIRFQGAN